MKKIYIIGLLICFSLFLFGCSLFKPDKISVQTVQTNCSAMGYVTPQEANALVNLTNKLVDITNYCFANQNITPLAHLRYWPDLNKTS